MGIFEDISDLFSIDSESFYNQLNGTWDVVDDRDENFSTIGGNVELNTGSSYTPLFADVQDEVNRRLSVRLSQQNSEHFQQTMSRISENISQYLEEVIASIVAHEDLLAELGLFDCPLQNLEQVNWKEEGF